MNIQKMKIDEGLISSYAVKENEARKLREICRDIDFKHGFKVKESQIISFILDYGLNRITYDTDGIRINGETNNNE